LLTSEASAHNDRVAIRAGRAYVLKPLVARNSHSNEMDALCRQYYFLTVLYWRKWPIRKLNTHHVRRCKFALLSKTNKKRQERCCLRYE
jgi:hypothetical protein